MGALDSPFVSLDNRAETNIGTVPVQLKLCRLELELKLD